MPVGMQGGAQGICMRLSDMTQDQRELSVLQATLDICLWAAEIIPRCLPPCENLNCCLGFTECIGFIDHNETLDTAPRRVPKFSSADKKAVHLRCPLPLLHRVCRVSFKQEPLTLGNMFIRFLLLALDRIEHLCAPQLHLFASKWHRDAAVLYKKESGWCNIPCHPSSVVLAPLLATGLQNGVPPEEADPE